MQSDTLMLTDTMHLQVYAYDRNQETGRLSLAATRAYRRREREIARKALNDSGLSSGDLVAFITKQTEWWDYATRIGPAAIADEYKHNISSSLRMHRLVTKTATRKVVERVGRRGHFRPILEVIFLDWMANSGTLRFARSRVGPMQLERPSRAVSRHRSRNR